MLFRLLEVFFRQIDIAHNKKIVLFQQKLSLLFIIKQDGGGID